MSVLIKDVDKILYSQFKAQAALRGIKVGEALNLAIEKWLQDMANESDEEIDRSKNNSTFRRLFPELIKDHEGEWIVISQGRMVGLFDTIEDAAKAIEDNGLYGLQNILTQLTSGKRTVKFGIRRRREA